MCKYLWGCCEDLPYCNNFLKIEQFQWQADGSIRCQPSTANGYASLYNEEHQDVKITYHADSSGTLLTQIEEGGECDLFFSAAQKQMDQLEADGLVEEGTRANVVNNQVTVVTRKGSGTQVNLGVLDEAEDVSDITAQEVADALGGSGDQRAG